MNERFKHAFGDAPDGFEAAMRGAMTTARSNVPRKLAARQALIAAALALLLCGAAYALARGLGILEMLGARIGVTPDAARLVQTNITQQGGNLELATFTLEQVISDGEMVYFTLRAAPAKPDEVILLDDAQSPGEWNEKGDETYAEQAERKGKRLMRALFSHVQVNDEEYPECQQISAARDGNDFVYAFYAAAKTRSDAPLNLTVHVDAYHLYEPKSIERGTLTAQVEPGNEAVSHRWTNPVRFDDLGIEVLSVRVTDTPVLRFGEIHYRVLPTEDLAQLATAHSVWPSFRSQTGGELESMGGTEEELADESYVVRELLPPAESPGNAVIALKARGGIEIMLTLDINDAQKEAVQ